MRSSDMRILSFGAGAIGTYIGGNLALHGHSVTFLEQPAVAAELRQRGLRIKHGDEEHILSEVPIFSDLEEALKAGHYDAALFALKSYDTQIAVNTWQPYLSALPPVLCLQNGVENEITLSNVLGEERVISATITTAIGRQAAGDIVVERLRGMGVAAGHPLSEQLVQALNDAGLNAHLFPNAADMKWSKMLTNLLANASSAILDMDPAKIFAHRGLFRLEVEQLREALRVMAALNIHTVDLPKTPVRALAFAVYRLPREIARPLLARRVGAGRGGKMPSLHIDLHSGRGYSEVDYLNGAVVRFGKKTGVATPVNRLLNDTLLALVEGRSPRDTYIHQPEKLLTRL
jgi:2-dehydropantoate 2-reductase